MKNCKKNSFHKAFLLLQYLWDVFGVLNMKPLRKKKKTQNSVITKRNNSVCFILFFFLFPEKLNIKKKNDCTILIGDDDVIVGWHGGIL